MAYLKKFNRCQNDVLNLAICIPKNGLSDFNKVEYIFSRDFSNIFSQVNREEILFARFRKFWRLIWLIDIFTSALGLRNYQQKYDSK